MVESSRKLAVLLVGDQTLDAFGAYRAALAGEGHHVITVATYDQAIEHIRTERVELVITDVNLGPDSGHDILQRIIERGMNLPVIVFVDEESFEKTERALELGAYDVVKKWVDPSILLRIAKRALYYRLRLAMERYREEETRRYRYRLLDAVFRGVNEGIVTVDNDMRVIESNKTTEALCGVNSRRMTDELISQCGQRCRLTCLEALQATLTTRSPVTEYHIECGRENRPTQTIVVNTSPLIDENMQFFGAVLMLKDTTQLSNLERELEDRYRFESIIGASASMKDLFRVMEALAGTEATALLTGETGVGKELVARAIHYASSRAIKPFVAVNCSALAEELLESELFGHVKGAFTGAITDRVGRFAQADGGTLLLDEIGDISTRVQLKLLRVLQEREFEPVGSGKTVKVDVRVIAATHHNLRAKIEQGLFREDLYYRLNVVELTIPPLRDRTADIPLLLDHFIGMFNKKHGKEVGGISDEALAALMRYHWPGNVRELQHAVEHAFVLVKGGVITHDALPVVITTSITGPTEGKRGSGSSNLESAKPSPVEKFTGTVEEALRLTGGNKVKAAKLMGVSRQTIYRKIQVEGEE